MPALDNPRHERFCQALAKGKTADEAYKEAGYKANRHNAAALGREQHIKTRVAELQEPGAKRARITAQRLMEMAETVYDNAVASGQNSAAIAAVKELGVLSGERIEKRETGGPGDFERMGDDELDAYIAQRERALREGVEGTGDQAVSPRLRGKLN